ncbi:DHH family phosphoesterase [Lacticaseibacillus sharpeae]|uniref:Cyclic-di-AMP phosphodiesterase n=1 Tax=Lacticaseibacillus sharpeae JCM 1186 = DSM 20505 TaxID=1291052 RepID=A0A0R1ZK73_9LACO|nr:DHH family phosphoesterase [Lacticaseibacillus sharpeae]KRM55344.1 Signaling protein (consists of PAS, a modified GGDEF and a DHH family phosphatase domains) [Lacticaseibacillus sharpeae JCM 1186 = DSM 20505]
MQKIKGTIKLPAFLEDVRLRYVSLAMVALAVAGIIIAFFIKPLLALGMTVVLIGILLASFYTLETITKNTNKYIANLSYRIKRGEQEALVRMPMGILMYDKKMNIEWLNPFLRTYFGDEPALGRNLADVDGELAAIIAGHQDSKEPRLVHWGENQFEITVQSSIGVVYMMDVTRYAAIEQRAADEKIVIGQIFLDNYDEVTQSLDDQLISNLSNYVTTELTTWATKFGFFVKRVDEDHFILIAYAKALRAVIADKFRILDTIREGTSKQNAPLTLSIGIAYGDTDLGQLALTSQSNLDLALGRGGDQVVVKARTGEAKFYGGKTNPMEKRTRVRARMISQALQELFKQTDKIYVVGHGRPDMDSIGAALGVRRIAQMNGKECYVVLDPTNLHSDVERLMEKVASDPELANQIITPEAAIGGATDKSMLVMVDHSKPSITTAPELYTKLQNRVVILDHHRRGEEFPDNPMLVYIEPYASSTCELIAEMFEYQPQGSAPLNKLEATAMLAGITVDTKNFALRTGTRTFDAASYLRSMGADAKLISNMLKENLDSYIQKNHLIDGVEMIGDNMAVACGEEVKSYDPVIAAQAADTLLSLSGIDASFVVTKRRDGKVGISARSLGDINVQLIMERLGGGGHLSNAATQMAGVTVADAKGELLNAIHKELTQEDD